MRAADGISDFLRDLRPPQTLETEAVAARAEPQRALRRSAYAVGQPEPGAIDLESHRGRHRGGPRGKDARLRAAHNWRPTVRESGVELTRPLRYVPGGANHVTKPKPDSRRATRLSES